MTWTITITKEELSWFNGQTKPSPFKIPGPKSSPIPALMRKSIHKNPVGNDREI